MVLIQCPCCRRYRTDDECRRQKQSSRSAAAGRLHANRCHVKTGRTSRVERLHHSFTRRQYRISSSVPRPRSHQTILKRSRQTKVYRHRQPRISQQQANCNTATLCDTANESSPWICYLTQTRCHPLKYCRPRARVLKNRSKDVIPTLPN